MNANGVDASFLFSQSGIPQERTTSGGSVFSDILQNEIKGTATGQNEYLPNTTDEQKYGIQATKLVLEIINQKTLSDDDVAELKELFSMISDKLINRINSMVDCPSEVIDTLMYVDSVKNQLQTGFADKNFIFTAIYKLQKDDLVYDLKVKRDPEGLLISSEDPRFEDLYKNPLAKSKEESAKEQYSYQNSPNYWGEQNNSVLQPQLPQTPNVPEGETGTDKIPEDGASVGGNSAGENVTDKIPEDGASAGENLGNESVTDKIPENFDENVKEEDKDADIINEVAINPTYFSDLQSEAVDQANNEFFVQSAQTIEEIPYQSQTVLNPLDTSREPDIPDMVYNNNTDGEVDANGIVYSEVVQNSQNTNVNNAQNVQQIEAENAVSQVQTTNPQIFVNAEIALDAGEYYVQINPVDSEIVKDGKSEYKTDTTAKFAENIVNIDQPQQTKEFRNTTFAAAFASERISAEINTGNTDPRQANISQLYNESRTARLAQTNISKTSELEELITSTKTLETELFVNAEVTYSELQVTASPIPHGQKLNSLEKALVSEIIARFNAMSGMGKDTTSFEMKLNPESLGEITVKIIEKAGKVSVSIYTTTKEAQAMLTARLDTIGGALKENGTQLESFQIVHQSNQNSMQNGSYDGSSKNPYSRKEQQDNSNEQSDIEFSELLQSV